MLPDRTTFNGMLHNMYIFIIEHICAGFSIMMFLFILEWGSSTASHLGKESKNCYTSQSGAFNGNAFIWARHEPPRRHGKYFENFGESPPSAFLVWEDLLVLSRMYGLSFFSSLVLKPFTGVFSLLCLPGFTSFLSGSKLNNHCRSVCLLFFWLKRIHFWKA